MYWNNLKILLAFLAVSSMPRRLHAQRGGSTYKVHNHLFGPAAGIGIGYGSAKDVPSDFKKNLPGSSVDFGFNYYYFKTASLALGTGLRYSINRWNLQTFPAEYSLNQDASYRITERHVSVPLEVNWYITPYSDRFFLGFGVDPGYLIQRDLERKRSNNTDTAFAYRYPQAGTEYSRFSTGITLKIGWEADLGFSSVTRFCLQWTNRAVLRRNDGLRSSGMVLLSAQYFFSE